MLYVWKWLMNLCRAILDDSLWVFIDGPIVENTLWGENAKVKCWQNPQNKFGKITADSVALLKTMS